MRNILEIWNVEIFELPRNIPNHAIVAGVS
jgi:hypothetical protein